MNTNYLMEKKSFHLFYKLLLNKNYFIYCDPKRKIVKFDKHEIDSLPDVYYLISCVIFGLFSFFFLYAKLNTSVYL